MPIIWTNEESRVTSIHYKPELLDENDKQGSIRVDSIPNRDSAQENEELHYDSQQGLYFQERVSNS